MEPVRAERGLWAAVAGGLVLATGAGAAAPNSALTCLQEPMFWMVGEHNRILIETPGDCGPLAVTAPPELELFDRWPWTKGDTRQRFYFRAKAPLAEGRISFKSGAYSLEVPVEILTWAQARMPRQFENWQLPRTFPMEGEDEHKKGTSFLSKEELAALRREGAPDVEAILRSLPPDDHFYDSMAECTLARVASLQNQYGEMSGCPVCGRKVFEGRSPFRPWLIDPQKHPWKVGCPECGRWFPSNDFAAGDRHSGEFPDDGWGYVKPGDPLPYCFIAYYAHWSYLGHYKASITRLCDAYARTGNREIGHTAALGLFRVAEQHLSMALNLNHRCRLMVDAVWTGQVPPQTKINIASRALHYQASWQTGEFPNYCAAMDKLWGFFDEADPGLLAFVQSRGHPEIRTMSDFRNFIEVGYFRTFLQACLDRCVVGNFPRSERAVAQGALFLNTPRSVELVDWLYNGDAMMRHFLTNDTFIDGSPSEAPDYNAKHARNFEALVEAMARVRELQPDRYPPEKYPPLTADPKCKRVYDFWIDYNTIGRTHAQVGDSGTIDAFDPPKPRQTAALAPSDFIGPYARTRDPRFARVLYDPRTQAPIPEVTDPELREAIRQEVAAHGWSIEQPSTLLDGCGHAILRAGEGDDRRALWVRYGRARVHGHHDMLTIGYEAKRRSLLPELGYPRSFDANTRLPWDANWATHYCARILGEGGPEPEGNMRWWQGGGEGRGHCKLFADGPWARVATAYTPLHEDVPPPEVARLRPERIMERTVSLIDLDEKDSYVVDVYRLQGGTEHYLSFHGPQYEREATIEGLELTKQTGGTLAGPDIARGQLAEWGKANPLLIAFPWMFDVSRSTARDPWSLDWPVRRHPDVRLRATLVPCAAVETALAKGTSPGGGEPYELQYVVQRTKGERPLRSQFVSVLEAYEGARRLSGVSRLKVETEDPSALPPVALRVRAGARADTVVTAFEAQPCTAGGVSTDGSFAVWSEDAGTLRRAYLVGGRRLKKGDAGMDAASAEWRGRIVAVDYGRRQVSIRPAAPYPAALVGRTLRITNEFSDCSHRIEAAANQGDVSVLTLQLDPRIGEGPVVGVEAGAVTSGATMGLSGLRYFHGKTLANQEEGSAAYRVSGVVGKRVIHLDATRHGSVPAGQLDRDFADRDGDGIRRFFIYDYGVGDTTSVPTLLSLRSTRPGLWELETPVDVTLSLAGQEPVVIRPGSEGKARGVSFTSKGGARMVITVSER
ncbi:MAG: hypothetical protein HY321_19035 [Armatimonadetes bacterium]|nr:hypothetical protein [Armatimonadota bacterium]